MGGRRGVGVGWGRKGREGEEKEVEEKVVEKVVEEEVVKMMVEVER